MIVIIPDDTDEEGICEYCGNPTEYFGPDPYDCEVNNNCEEYWICDECYSNKSEGI